MYDIVKDQTRVLDLYTYELRYGSKAETVFLGEADIQSEDLLWKELLIFFMNTRETSGYIDFLRGIEPLGFDPELTSDYLECFQSDSAKSQVIGELETLYEDLEGKSERLEMMKVIGSPNVSFEGDDQEVDEKLFPDFYKDDEDDAGR